MRQIYTLMENLLTFISEHSEDDVSRLILDRAKYPGIDIELAVNSIESRRKIRNKVPQWYENQQLIFPLKLSAEQCSSSATGSYKAKLAEKIADKKRWTIADLTGGLGVDSWFFSQKAQNVIYNEMQTALCEAAEHNFKALGADNIEVINSIITKGRLAQLLSPEAGIDMAPDIVYMDPARRSESGKKVFLIEDCTPDVLTIKNEIFDYCRHILIKLSPMADITMVCQRLGSTCREVHVVSSGGECKELLIWMDREWNEEYSINAVELHPDFPASIFRYKPSEEKSSTATLAARAEGFLFEPGKALMKAGAYNLICSRAEVGKLGKSTHYYVTDSQEKAEGLRQYGKVFRILECQSLDKRTIKEIGSRYPNAEVTARNIPMDTDTLRKKLGITSGDDAHIFGLRSDLSGNLLIAARRLV